MFEKNKSIPTPIARFGESVTPAMIAANAKPNQAPITEAWKRKRYFILQDSYDTKKLLRNKCSNLLLLG